MTMPLSRIRNRRFGVPAKAGIPMDFRFRGNDKRGTA
jgi:hypothetical protein